VARQSVLDGVCVSDRETLVGVRATRQLKKQRGDHVFNTISPSKL
jgi:hypothetical protein